MKTYRVIVTIDMVNADTNLGACVKVGDALRDVPIDGYPRSDIQLRAVEGTATEIQAREIEELQQRIKVYEAALRGRQMTNEEQKREAEWHKHRDLANTVGSAFWNEPPIPGLPFPANKKERKP